MPKTVTDYINEARNKLQNSLVFYMTNANEYVPATLIFDIREVTAQRLPEINDWTQSGCVEDLLKAIQQPLQDRIGQHVKDCCVKELQDLCKQLIQETPDDVVKVDGVILNSDTLTGITQIILASVLTNLTKKAIMAGAEEGVALAIGEEALGCLIPGVGEVMLFVLAAQIISSIWSELIFSKDDILKSFPTDLHKRLTSEESVNKFIAQSTQAFEDALKTYLKVQPNP